MVSELGISQCGTISIISDTRYKFQETKVVMVLEEFVFLTGLYACCTLET